MGVCIQLLYDMENRQEIQMFHFIGVLRDITVKSILSLFEIKALCSD